MEVGEVRNCHALEAGREASSEKRPGFGDSPNAEASESDRPLCGRNGLDMGVDKFCCIDALRDSIAPERSTRLSSWRQIGMSPLLKASHRVCGQTEVST